MLDLGLICKKLDNNGISEEKIHVFESIGSTNTQMKQYAEAGAGEFELIIAEHQQGGRGRMGRVFFSPDESGVYLSLLLCPHLPPSKASLLTVCAAVAGCMAIENALGVNACIKWVNDLYFDGRKVGGILTEGAIDPDNGMLKYAIVGIGINVFKPEGGFPSELEGIAGALLDAEDFGENSRKRELLAAEFVSCFKKLYRGLGDNNDGLYREYSKRMFLCGMEVDVLSHCGDEKRSALVLGVNSDFSLRVRYDDMTEQDIFDGEVSLRIRR